MSIESIVIVASIPANSNAARSLGVEVATIHADQRYVIGTVATTVLNVINKDLRNIDRVNSVEPIYRMRYASLVPQMYFA